MITGLGTVILLVIAKFNYLNYLKIMRIMPIINIEAKVLMSLKINNEI